MSSFVGRIVRAIFAKMFFRVAKLSVLFLLRALHHFAISPDRVAFPDVLVTGKVALLAALGETFSRGRTSVSSQFLEVGLYIWHVEIGGGSSSTLFVSLAKLLLHETACLTCSLLSVSSPPLLGIPVVRP